MFLHPLYLKQQKRSVVLGTLHTSYTLEPLFHTALAELAERDGVSVSAMVAEVNRERGEDTNLSSALRLYVLARLRYDLEAMAPAVSEVAI